MRTEYEQRLAARRAAAEQHDAVSKRLGTWRLALVVAGLALAFVNIWTLPATLAAFVALIVWHERIARAASSERRAMAFYERGLARLDGRWAGSGASGARFLDPKQPYASDLDVFGDGSLFQLISAARTSMGEATLARWLSAPASVHEVTARQQAIDELRERLDLREDLALLGDDVQAELHADQLSRWAETKRVEFLPGARVIAFILAAFTVAALVGFFLQLWHWRWPLLLILNQGIFGLVMRERVQAVLGAVDARARDLDVLARVLARFEAERFSEGRLAELRDELTLSGAESSQRIVHLQKLIEYHDWTHNLFFRPFAALLLWSTHNAIAIERWRARNGTQVSGWLAAVGELEALSSLAGYAAENPHDMFPELAAEGPLFSATGLAHPLLPAASEVRNDVELSPERQLLIVSGSNMSGKSTLLRAVGLNAVLAWAGAPVRAESLRISPLSVGAAMRVQDSLLEGKSRFYAEITRIRQIVGMAGGEPPLLFVFDEMLSGTNSHDRRIGAEAILRTLVERGAIGLVTTHDLALADIAASLPGRAVNVHFEDHIEDGVVAFDYRMRPGVVARSNALALMRAVGLQV